MMVKINTNPQLRDAASERLLLSAIIRYGKDAYIDISDIITASDFGISLNQDIFSVIKKMYDHGLEVYDPESIKVYAKNLGINNITINGLEYVDILDKGAPSLENIIHIALGVKKYAIARELHTKYTQAALFLENLSHSSTINEIIAKAEGMISDFLGGINQNNTSEALFENITTFIEDMIRNEPVEHLGISTGFDIYDDAIGGYRPGTVNVIGARTGKGKSYFAANVSLNVAKQGIPVLYLDTELIGDDQKKRMLAIASECPIYLLETRQFKYDKNLTESVINAGKQLRTLPFTYENISGVDYIAAVNKIKRWLIKKVGFQSDGTANPCLVIYDYLKLTGNEKLESFMPEYIVLGLAMTQFHNLTTKYKFPMLTLVQLNREGLENEHDGTISGSDRIAWLCSSLGILKDKGENEKSLGDPMTNGNKKLVLLKSRHGSGFEFENDYINIKASLRPETDKFKATGKMIEGFKFSQVASIKPEDLSKDSK